MVIEGKKGAPVIASTRLQLVLYGLHFVEQTIEFCVLISQQHPVLIERNRSKTLDQLVHGHLMECLLHSIETCPYDRVRTAA